MRKEQLIQKVANNLKRQYLIKVAKRNWVDVAGENIRKGWDYATDFSAGLPDQIARAADFTDTYDAWSDARQSERNAQIANLSTQQQEQARTISDQLGRARSPEELRAARKAQDEHNAYWRDFNLNPNKLSTDTLKAMDTGRTGTDRIYGVANTATRGPALPPKPTTAAPQGSKQVVAKWRPFGMPNMAQGYKNMWNVAQTAANNFKRPAGIAGKAVKGMAGASIVGQIANRVGNK